MKTIGLLAQKGGAGKTSLALHWAVEADVGKKTSVAVIDIDLQGSAASWSLRREKGTPIMLQANEDNVREAVEVCEKNGMDYVFIDTMPRVERSTLEAAKVSDLAVIPCGPAILDIEAIGSTVEIIERVGIPGVIMINQGRPGSPINKKAADVLKQYGLPICPIRIMRRAALADAFNDGRAVRELSPKSKGAQEITASWRWVKKQLGGKQ